MGSGGVVVVDEGLQHPAQVVFVEDQEMVETLFARGADPAFRERIGIGRLEGGGNDVDMLRAEDCMVSLGELAVIVVDQETGFEVTLLKDPDVLPGLLGHPETIRMSGDSSQVNSAGTDFDVEQHIQCLQPEGFHGEEITGEELLFVVGHQLSPAEGAIANGRGHDAVPVKDVAYSGLGDLAS